MFQQSKIPQAKPDFTGPAGQAWKADVSTNPSMVGLWIVHCPQVHPFLQCFAAGVVHLREQGGLKPAMIYLEGATHELFVAALDPDFVPPLTPSEQIHFLTPMNFGAQFICPSDEASAAYVEHDAILPLVNGLLNPDTDYLQQWVQVFGDSMILK